MPVYTVNVKWITQRFNEVQLDTDEPTIVFKAQLMTLTNVSVERQKVIIKGKMIEDDWEGINVSNGQMITLLGQAGDVPPLNATNYSTRITSPPKILATNVSENKLASSINIPIEIEQHEVIGLENNKNTCYLNAIIQCLWTIPEIKEAISYNVSTFPITKQKYTIYKDFSLISDSKPKPVNTHYEFIQYMRDLFKCSSTVETVYILRIFISSLHKLFPRYAEKDAVTNMFRQHDAGEVLTDIMNVIKDGIDFNSPKLKNKNLIDLFFGIKIHSRTSNDDEEFESEESEYQLSCAITKSIDHLLKGINLTLTSNLSIYSEKHKEERDYTRISRFKRLPAYLIVQLNRFYYREDTNTNAKIVKNVNFPKVLDLNNVCTPELQTRMSPFRSKIERHDKKTDSKDSNLPVYFHSQVYEPYWFEDDFGSNASGLYQLVSVVTHMGRTSDSGHYVSWIRQENDIWVKADDINVSSHNFDEVLKSSGGTGDWHIAYILIYGPKLLPL